MTYKKERKANFRLTEVLNSTRNRFVSSLSFAIITALLLTTTRVNGAEDLMTAKGIKSQVSEQFSQQVARLAGQRHWQNYQLNAEIRVPSSANHLPECPNPLVISDGDNKALPIGNLKRSVSCQSADVDWRLNVSIKSTLTLNVLIAKSPINRDDSITRDLVTIEQRTLNREQDFYTQFDQVRYKLATRRIRSGQIIDGRKLQTPALVAKGNQVIISAGKDGFSATTKGVALEQGAHGQQIEVRNISSGKVVKAVVTGLNQVATQF